MLNAIIVIWTILLVVTGYSPYDRLTWFLEVAPVLVAIPLLLITRRSFPLAKYILIWVFIHGVVLMIGGHYTYARVPLGFWVQEALHLARNHYDRLGHLMQGFVPALITREILVRHQIVVKKAWVFFLTVTICMSISVFYEFIEWASALILGQGANEFLGTQGDAWDTQWDMFLATIGAIAAQMIYRGKSE